MTAEHANQIPMAEILSKVLAQPKRVQANKLFYPSPLQKQKSAFLEVDRKTNCWYDHQQGIGGTPVDFVCVYLKATHEAHAEPDALRWLKNMGLARFDTTPIHDQTSEPTTKETALVLKSKKPIQHLGLIRYLEKRGIPLAIAQCHLKEIRAHDPRSQKNITALGFPNEEGGFKLINPFFNGRFGPQAISFIRSRQPKPIAIHLFTNWMDYLSAIAQLNGKSFTGDVIILNSLPCLKQALPYIQNYGYHTAYSWLNNNQAGEKATTAFAKFCQTEVGLKHTSMNMVYAPHQDVNAWHMHKQNLTL